MTVLPQNRPAKILLLVHGTFSSTAGGFGHLLLSDCGRDFLKRAHATYDAILAFDHKTLELEPHAMIDLYTNATMAGARAVVLLAGGGALSPLVPSGIKTVGRFVQMFSEVAITNLTAS